MSLVLEQLEVSLFPNLVIRASAGTGKTYHLSNRFLKLIFEGVAVDQILATTFTRQAAREILDRIMSRIATAASSQLACDELAAAIDVASLSPDKCKQKLAYLTSNLHRLRISTLDAFFIRIAQSISLELGLPPGWQIADESEEARLRDHAIQDLLLNDKPRRVVELMHLLTKADAKRGVAELIRSTVTELHDMYLESDTKAWKRLKRVDSIDDQTYHNAVHVLEDYNDLPKSLQKAKNSDFQRIACGNWDDFLKSGIGNKVANGEATYNRVEIPELLAEVYRKIIQYASAAIRYRTLVQTESRHHLLSRFDKFYQQRKVDARGFRFADINRALVQLNESDFERIAFRMNATIEHLLLDEFQDTSLDQWRVLAPFAKRTTNESGDGSFFCVGDMKQAIYGWRGGDCEILDLMDRQLTGIEQQGLSKSFRSSQTVIDFVNTVNLGLPRHSNLSDNEAKTAKQWCDRFPEHSTARTELPGHVTIETAPLAEDNDDDSQKDVTLRHTANQVAKLARRSPSMKIAVLTRTNPAVAKIIFYLQQTGVAATEVGGNPLTDSAAVQLVLSLLRLVDHPGDRVAQFHLAKSPWAKELGFTNCDDGRSPRLCAEVRRRIFDDGIGDSIYQWSQQLRPFCNDREFRRLNQLTDLAFDFQNQIENPSQSGYTSQRRRSLRTAEFIELVKRRRVADPSSNQVAVMTVHQSKGLQFDTVFVTELDRRTQSMPPDCVAARPTPFDRLNRVSRYVNKELLIHFPQEVQDLHKAYEQTSFREELCVLYVALTRAISGLYLVIDPDKKKKSEKSKPPKSPTGLIRAALDDKTALEPEAMIFEAGDPNWYMSDQSERAVLTTATAIPFPSVRLRLANNVAPVGGLSPSKREGSGRIRLDNRLNLTSSGAMRFGTVMHAWLEQVEWLDDFSIDDETRRRIARMLDMNEVQVATATRAFSEVVARPAIRQLLTRSEYANSARIGDLQAGAAKIEVRNEQPIAANLSDGIVSGFIDRLVVFSEPSGAPIAADIIDFKTDSIDAATGTTLESKVAHYRPQLAAYREAVQRMLKLPTSKIKTTLAFVGTGDVVDV